MSAADLGLRETLFGDVPVAVWAGNGAGEPWSSFALAAGALERGDSAEATRTLQEIVQQAGRESRHYVEAWNALRQLGVAPPPVQAKHVYGVVVDVPVEDGFDTVAAFEDRSARYLNFSGAVVVWDAPDSRMDARVRELLAAGQQLATLIGPWEGERPPLTPLCARISLLTPSGLHFGEGPFEDFAGDPMASPVIAAAASLMQSLISVADGG